MVQRTIKHPQVEQLFALPLRRQIRNDFIGGPGYSLADRDVVDALVRSFVRQICTLVDADDIEEYGRQIDTALNTLSAIFLGQHGQYLPIADWHAAGYVDVFAAEKIGYAGTGAYDRLNTVFFQLYLTVLEYLDMAGQLSEEDWCFYIESEIEFYSDLMMGKYDSGPQ